jgi:MFS family permease
MAFGVLSDPKTPFPRGTTLLSDQTTSKDTKTHLILVPQPSKSPNDPLNLSKVRKELLFLVIVFGASATGVIGPLLVPGFNIVASYFQVTLTKVALLNGSLVMALGVSSYLCSCFSIVYGRRLVYLFTTLLLVATCCWGAAAQSYRSLLAARVFQGALLLLLFLLFRMRIPY